MLHLTLKIAIPESHKDLIARVAGGLRSAHGHAIIAFEMLDVEARPFESGHLVTVVMPTTHAGTAEKVAVDLSVSVLAQ